MTFRFNSRHVCIIFINDGYFLWKSSNCLFVFYILQMKSIHIKGFFRIVFEFYKKVCDINEQDHHLVRCLVFEKNEKKVRPVVVDSIEGIGGWISLLLNVRKYYENILVFSVSNINENAECRLLAESIFYLLTATSLFCHSFGQFRDFCFIDDYLLKWRTIFCLVGLFFLLVFYG